VRDLGSTHGTWIPRGGRWVKVEKETLVPLPTPVVIGNAIVVITAWEPRPMPELLVHKGLVVCSGRTAEIVDEIRSVARSNVPVFLHGEPGTGKELLALLVHILSGRKEKYLPINCASISKDLAETQLFGHKRGAFTGAVADALGAFEVADKGTLFLDEIGELPEEVQAKLLRVLETGIVHRLGWFKDKKVDTRVVAATNCPCLGFTSDSKMRPDLLARLVKAGAHVPSLRFRIEEIAALMWNHVRSQKLDPSECLSRDFVACALVRDGKANIRELLADIETAILRRVGDAKLDPKYLGACQRRLDEFEAEAKASVPPDGPDNGETGPLDSNELLRYVWRLTHGNISLMADFLGWDRKVLHRRLDKTGLRRNGRNGEEENP